MPVRAIYSLTRQLSAFQCLTTSCSRIKPTFIWTDKWINRTVASGVQPLRNTSIRDPFIRRKWPYGLRSPRESLFACTSLKTNEDKQLQLIQSVMWEKKLEDVLVPELQNFVTRRSYIAHVQHISSTSSWNFTPELIYIYISVSGDINWPPRSPDWSPMNFFMWEFLKSKVYANK